MMSSVRTATKAAESQAYQLAIGKGMSRKRALAEANSAGQLEYQQQLQGLEQMAVSSGINGTPSIDDPQFIPEIVFDQTRGVNQPKARFAYLFPSSRSALSSAAGPWHTAAMTLSSSSIAVSRRPSSGDSARSSIGP